MPKYTQTGRTMAIATPLGDDALLLELLAGSEAISELFQFDVEMLAEPETAIAFDKVLGQPTTIALRLQDDSYRYINGIINRFAQGEEIRGPHGDVNFVRYRATVVPKLWLLTRRARCRIFQHVSVPDILRTVLAGIDVSHALEGTYEPRDYCVQYRESDFDFASRLMEEEGIFYFFDHAVGRHTLVLADSPNIHAQYGIDGPVRYETMTSNFRVENRIYSWVKTQEIRSGKQTLWDHSFELPGQNLQAQATTQESVAIGTITHKLQVGGNSELELYDFPGAYAQRFDGTAPGGGERSADVQKIFHDNIRTTAIRMEQETVQGIAIVGEGSDRQMTPGFRFSLAGHYNADGEYTLTRVEHRATLVGAYTSGAAEAFTPYSNQFKCIPAALPFRPLQVTHKVQIIGTQSAVVVGPAGSEIFTDKYGRVKVQFAWDRDGQKNADSSCWVRVTSFWAGKQWGAVHIPRIGQEVVVAFEEGDPDQPIIVGSVYNAEQMPPYVLPDNMTQSGIKSRSSMKGTTENFNELRFEDKKGSEQVYFHAEKNFDRVVENNDTLKVGFVKRDKGDQTIHIHNNQDILIGVPTDDGVNPTKGSQYVSIWNDQAVVIGHGKGVNADGDQSVAIWNNQDLIVGGGKGSNADGSQTTTIYKDRTTTLKTGDDTLTVTQGMRTVTIEKDDKLTLKSGDRVAAVETGNDKLEIKMGNQTTKVALGSIATEAMQSIEFKVGSSSIKIDQMGVTIKGMMIKIEGQMMVDIKGMMTNVKADAMLMCKGAITMIN